MFIRIARLLSDPNVIGKLFLPWDPSEYWDMGNFLYYGKMWSAEIGRNETFDGIGNLRGDL